MAEPFDPANAQRLEDRARLEALPPCEVVSLLRLADAETWSTPALAPASTPSQDP